MRKVGLFATIQMGLAADSVELSGIFTNSARMQRRNRGRSPNRVCMRGYKLSNQKPRISLEIFYDQYDVGPQLDKTESARLDAGGIVQDAKMRSLQVFWHPVLPQSHGLLIFSR